MEKKIIRPFLPTVGEVYKNKGGGTYRCVKIYSIRDVRMINVNSGWEFTAHTIQRYPDGTIEWDYSTDGRWKS